MRVRREKKKKNSADILQLVRQNVRHLDDKQLYEDSIIQYCLTKACEVALSEGHSLISQWNLGKAGNDFSVLSSFLIPRVISSKNGTTLPSGTGWILGGNYSLCEFLLFPINFEVHTLVARNSVAGAVGGARKRTTEALHSIFGLLVLVFFGIS